MTSPSPRQETVDSACHDCAMEDVRRDFLKVISNNIEPAGIYANGKWTERCPDRWRSTLTELEGAACEGTRHKACERHAIKDENDY